MLLKFIGDMVATFKQLHLLNFFVSLLSLTISDIMTPRERGKYNGIMGGVFALASVIGPLVGGALTDHVSWRWCFYINLPFGCFAIVVIFYGLRRAGQPLVEHPKIDFAGTILIIVAVILLILPLNWGGTK